MFTKFVDHRQTRSFHFMVSEGMQLYVALNACLKFTFFCDVSWVFNPKICLFRQSVSYVTYNVQMSDFRTSCHNRI